MAVSIRLLWLWLLTAGAAAVAVAAAAEDDFAFEFGPEDEPPPPGLGAVAGAGAPVRRQWGVPDSVAAVGRLFRLRVPSDAFSGDVRGYELVGSAPTWLRLDRTSGVLEGVPGPADAGDHYVTIRARGVAGDAAKDVFAVEVRPKTVARDARPEVQCGPGEEPVLLTVLLDARFESLSAQQRAAAVHNAAGFLALAPSALWLGPQRTREDLLGESVVAAGPGNARRQTAPQPTALRWAAGCDGRVGQAQLQAQARDGTLAEVLGLPVLGWHARVHGSSAGARERERREAGSGDFVDDDEPSYNYEEEEEGDGGEESVPEARIVPTMSSPVFPEATVAPEHPHRHHHGEPLPPPPPRPEAAAPPPSPPSLEPSATRRLPTSPVLFAGTIVSTPVLVPVRPTLLASEEVMLQPSRVYTAYAEVTPSATPVFYSEVEPSASTELPTSQVTEPLPSSSPSSSSSAGSTSESSPPPTGSSPSSSGSSPASTTEISTPTLEDTESPSPPSPSLPSTPTERSTTEKIEYGVKNIQPFLAHRLPKLPLTAGKTFRYLIPNDTFSDMEDGSTRKLRLIFMHLNKTSIMPSSWVQFDIERQEVYALPLEEHVSKWEFLLEAMDKEGASVSETLALQVQHHKGRRAVNHEFSFSLRPPDRIHYASNLDWEIEMLNGIAHTLGDSDTNHITVRSVNVSGDPNIFSWTNDSLPRSYCPKEDIERIYQVLTKNKSGAPSDRLRTAISHHLQIRKVTYRGLGQCDRPFRPEVPEAPPAPHPSQNFPPVTRNPIDRIDATVGQLLVFVVPPDVFYDPEQQPLKITLMTINNQPISLISWLQFDSKNQEFYGVPMPGDEGRMEYNLVCEDSEGQRSNDVLEVVVQAAQRQAFSVEFSMTLGLGYEMFLYSASIKRRFLERLRDLFRDRDTSAIVVKDVREGSTIVTWYNQTLPAKPCPEREVTALRKVLMNDDGTISSDVSRTMGLEFRVDGITITPVGACQGELTSVHVPESPPAVEDTVPATSSDNYFVTFIVPAVIIVAMLLLAGIVACVLYRRRRTGKMSVGDEDERQSFRNKGIPVIFQDELEERPDPANKSPVIMKEEKPPLPPPEYQRSGDTLERGTPPPPTSAAAAAAAAARRPLLGPDGSPAPAPEDPPYQPPPPFTSSRDSGRGARPKPTPTYRKPPPYVPP